MSKKLTTFEKEMLDPAFREEFQKVYKEQLLSDLLLAAMKGDEISVRSLAKEAKLSPIVIQDLKTGKQKDTRASSLVRLMKALGYEIILRKNGEELYSLDEEKIDNVSQLVLHQALNRTL